MDIHRKERLLLQFGQYRSKRSSLGVNDCKYFSGIGLAVCVELYGIGIRLRKFYASETS